MFALTSAPFGQTVLPEPCHGGDRAPKGDRHGPEGGHDRKTQAQEYDNWAQPGLRWVIFDIYDVWPWLQSYIWSRLKANSAAHAEAAARAWGLTT